MGRHSRTAGRLGFGAAGAAVLATAAAAFVPRAEAEPRGGGGPLAVTVVAVHTPTYTCDLSAPPAFGDPANPDTITNRACAYVDDQGRARSLDPWVDGQLLAR